MAREVAAILIVYFIAVAQYSTEARYTEEQIKEVGKLCNAVQTDIDVAVKYEVPTTSSGKCLMACILKKVQTLTEEGLYQKEQALTSLKKHWSEIETKKLEDLADECQKAVEGLESLAKSDSCEYGYKVAVCLNKLKDMPRHPECCTQRQVYARITKYKPYGKICGVKGYKKCPALNITLGRQTEIGAKPTAAPATTA